MSIFDPSSLSNKEDRVEILIDGQINELTKEVGSELFIHDFILPKEIAKFFFFDAEKIVELAEVKSIDDKRKLSKAYSEVLGIKKYEDLKELFSNTFNKDYTKEQYEQQFSIRIPNLLEKLDRIEEVYKEEDVPERFQTHIRQQRERLLEAKEKFGKDVISPFNF